MKSPHPDWTNARFKSFIISALRGAFRRYPPKQQCIAKAFTKSKINTKTGRMAKHHMCKKCKKEFPTKEVVADHIKPIVDPKVGFVDFNTWIERAYVPLTAFQCLCKECHNLKTAREKQQRKKKAI